MGCGGSVKKTYEVQATEGESLQQESDHAQGIGSTREIAQGKDQEAADSREEVAQGLDQEAAGESAVQLKEHTPSASVGALRRPNDPIRVAELQKAFPYQGEIAQTEHRGITVAQLRRVLTFVADSCAGWVDSSPVSNTSGQAISIDWANLYHVNTWLIRPSTLRDNCAFVELLSSKAQVPKWFISHWWGEPIWEFFACVWKHSTVRNPGVAKVLVDAVSYWVCAYANRQHDLGKELTINPKETSFFKAIDLAEGILLLLDGRKDGSGPGTPFKRIWCDFEESLAVEGMLDIATFRYFHVSDATPPDPLLVAKCSREGCDFLRHPSQGHGYCCTRCSINVSPHGAACTAERCTDSTESIKCARDGCQFARHATQGHSYCCAACMNHGIHGPACAKVTVLSQATLSDTIQQKDLLDLFFMGQAELLTDGVLPVDGKVFPTLRKAKRECTFPMELIEVGLQVKIQRGEASMPEDKTHILNCIAGQPLESTPLAEHHAYEMVNKRLAAKFAMAALPSAARLGKIDELPLFEKIGEDKWLSELALDVASCPALTDLKKLSLALSDRPNLKVLRLQLDKCQKLSNIEDLSQALATLPSVREFVFDCSACDNLSNVTPLGVGIVAMASLKKLVLILGNCDSLQSLEGLALCRSIQHFSLHCGFCRQLKSAAGLGKSLLACSELRDLEITFGACDDLVGIMEELELGISRHVQLRKLFVDMRCTNVVLEPEPIARGCAAAPFLQHVHVVLHVCPKLQGVEALAPYFSQMDLKFFFLGISEAAKNVPASLRRDFSSAQHFAIAVAGLSAAPAAAVAIKMTRNKGKVVSLKCGGDGPYNNGEDVHIWDDYKAGTQQYVFQDGFITLARNTNKVLSVATLETEGPYHNGTPVVLWDNVNAGTQQWVFENGSMKMARDKNKVLSVATPKTDGPYHNGTGIVIWDNGNSGTQQFVLEA